MPRFKALFFPGLIPFALLACFAKSALAAPVNPVTLSQALDQAVARNPSVQKAALALSIAEENLKVANSGRFPAVDLKGGYLKTSGAGSNVGFVSNNAPNEFIAQVGIVQPVYTSGALGAARDKAQALLLAARFDVGVAAQALRIQVISDYVGVLKGQEELAIAREHLKTSLAHQHQGMTMLNHGAIAPLDATRNALDVATVRLEVNRARTAVVTARAQLTADTGLPLEVVIRPLSKPETPQGDTVALTALAEARRPEAASIGENLKAAQTDIQAARAARGPQLSVLGNAGWDSPDFYSPNNAGWSAGVNLGLPLFEGGRLAALERSAGLSAERAGQDVEAEKRQIAQDVTQAVANRALAVRQSALAQESLMLAESASDMSKRGYQLGALSNLEFQLSEQALASALRQQADAVLDETLAIERLRWAVGESLP
jgi:outer membrane protein